MAALFDPLVVAIGKHVCAGEVLHADDTTVKVLAPGLGRTKTGRLWAAVRDERGFGGAAPPAAFYRYSADRCAKHAQALLAGCRGFLHADGYAGFNNLFAEDLKTGKPRLKQRPHARLGGCHIGNPTEGGYPRRPSARSRIARMHSMSATIPSSYPTEFGIST
jgi:hypothetical protein